MRRPRVSVIIPAYNSAEWIGRAVDSVLRQTEPDLEVVVIDDASQDETPSILRQLSDPRIRVVTLDENVGPATARNRGLEIARGEWVTFLDSDDWYGSGRLRTLLRVAAEHTADVVSDDLHYVDYRASAPWTTLLAMKRVSIFGPQSVTFVDFMRLDLAFQPMVRSAFLRAHDLRFPDGYRFAEDWYLWATTLLEGARWVQIPTGAYYYMARPGSLMTGPLDGARQEKELILRLLNEREATLSMEYASLLRSKLVQVRRREAYHRVVVPLKRGNLSSVIRALRENPDAWREFACRAPAVIRWWILRRVAMIRSRLSPRSPGR